VAYTPEEAKAAAEKIGGVTVVKAQVKVGGRGKAGGVKVAKSADEALEYANNILGMDIKGHTVKKVMIAQGADIAGVLLLRPAGPRQPQLPGHVLG
jgi:succinyl-CoA synthetase beta subunit